MRERTAGRGLGWASIAIGLTELCVPKTLERWMGISDGQNTGVLRAMGAREVATGVDLLANADAAPGVWSRVIGDALDLTLLVAAARQTRRPGGLAMAFGMVLGISVIDMMAARKLATRQYS